MSRSWAVGLALGLLIAAPAKSAVAEGQNFTLSCAFDPTESGTDPYGTVADGLGGLSTTVQFDLANAIARFRDGGTAPLAQADARSIVFREKEYTVTFDRDSGDLVSHDDKTGFEGTFHCLRVR